MKSLLRPRLRKAIRVSSLFILMNVLIGADSTLSAQDLECCPRPADIPGSSDFVVRVRSAGGEWKDIDTYAVEVDMHDPHTAAMAYFDFSGRVEVAVEWKGAGFMQRACVRPLSAGIEPVLSKKTLTFTLTEPRNLSIEVNGNRFRNLHLFAGPIPAKAPDPNVLYFGPGVHEPGEVLKIDSGKTVYLAGGAVLKHTKLLCDHVENVRILGRGVLYQGERGVEITNSKNVEIDGITVINPKHYTVLGGQSQGITIRNLKAFSSRGWSDGIDLMSCSDVLAEGLFMRNSDDCIALYAHRGDYSGDARNITVRNSTLWADVAHPINIGTHGNSEKPEVIENIIFENLDILNHDEPQISYQGCFAINASDENLVRKVRFENVRIEDFEQGQLFNFRVTFNRKYATAPGRGIEDVLVKDVTYNGSHANISIITGYNENRTVKNVIFENLRMNGNLVQSADGGRFFIGEHAEGIEFRTSAGKTPESK